MANKNTGWMSLLATPISIVPLFAMMQSQSPSQSRSQSSQSPKLQTGVRNAKLGLPFHEETETSMLMSDSSATNFYSGRTDYGTMHKGASIHEHLE
jgi:hypothetical protein